eukprot:jgi/Bigna1/85723/estExt_fgenesh1_pg.C_50340
MATPASLPARAMAKFIDLVAKTAVALSLGGIFTIKGLVFSTAYEVVLPVVWQGQTVGKKVMDIRFKRVDGKPIGIGTTVLRNLGDSLFCFLGFFAAAASNRTIADRMAGTEVIFDVKAKAKETTRRKKRKARKFVVSGVKIRSSL